MLEFGASQISKTSAVRFWELKGSWTQQMGGHTKLQVHSCFCTVSSRVNTFNTSTHHKAPLRGQSWEALRHPTSASRAFLKWSRTSVDRSPYYSEFDIQVISTFPSSIFHVVSFHLPVPPAQITMNSAMTCTASAQQWKEAPFGAVVR